MWRCSICSAELDGKYMRHHYRRCYEASSQSPTQASASDSATDCDDCVVPATLPVPLSPFLESSTYFVPETQMPASLPCPSPYPTSPYSSLVHPSASLGNPEATDSAQSRPSHSPTQYTALPSTKSVEFFDLWAPAFEGCCSRLNLNSVLLRCVEDWKEKSFNMEDRVGPNQMSQV